MRVLAFSLFAWTLVGCGDQEVEKTDTGTGDTGSEAVSYEVEVTADGNAEVVDIGTLETTTVEDADVVPVTSVLEATSLEVTWSERTYDFVASDGYRPSTKDCGPVDYTTLEGAYLYPESGNLTWSEDLGLEGCFYVDEVVTVEVQDAGSR